MKLRGTWYGVMQDVRGVEGEVAATFRSVTPIGDDGEPAEAESVVTGEFGFRFRGSPKPPLAVSAKLRDEDVEDEEVALSAAKLAGVDFGGPLGVTLKKDKVFLRFKGDSRAAGQPEEEAGFPAEFQFEGKMVDADPHARHAIFGCYEIREGSARSHFQGGYCVLWRYGRRKG